MNKECIYVPLTKPRRTAGARKTGQAKDRKLTVSYTRFNEKTVPFIRLSGDWLNRQGFNLGKKVIVREQPGELVIRLAEEGTAYEN